MSKLVQKITVLVVVQGILLPGLWASDLPGIVSSSPDDGRSIKTDQGFMVPYTMTIPGTKAQFSMEPIPGGKFKLGSPESELGHQDHEGPQVEVVIAPFWMGKYEVTWSEYKEFMNLYRVFKEFESRGVRPVTNENRVDAITAPTELYDPTFTFEFGEHARQPAVTMTQYSAKQYTKWLSQVTGQQYRLPSEAEWEYACRAGTTTAYYFGDDPSKLAEYAWFYDNANESLQKVGTKKPNPWGLHDMHGSVWEWVLDEFRPDGYRSLVGKVHSMNDSIAWPTKLYPRVVRGGSWDDEADRCRSGAKMASEDPAWKSEDPNLPLSPWWFTSDPSRSVGFRVVRPLKELPKEEMDPFWEFDVEEIEFDVQIRLEGGRGVLGVVDKELPAAVQSLEK